MADFDDVVLSSKFGYGAGGGPEFSTQITTLSNRREQRNQNWAGERRSYDLAYPVKNPADILDLQKFFRLRAGSARGFLHNDPLNNSSNETFGADVTMLDQTIGTGDGVTTDYQLKCTWSDAYTSIDYIVYKPVVATILISVDGVLKTLGVDYSIEALGIIRFLSGHEPASTKLVKAGFKYYTPVRFGTDKFTITYDDYNAFSVAQLPLIEVIPES
jgi:uncharacterized protein (TIGR02217 family)